MHIGEFISDENIVIRIESKSQLNRIGKILDTLGIRWQSGAIFTEFLKWNDNLKNDLSSGEYCININREKTGIVFGSVIDYKEDDKNIIPSCEIEDYIEE